MKNNTSFSPRSSYKTPSGMKRIWTVTGKNGVGRLLADAKQQTHVDITLHTSSKGTEFKKPMNIKCATSQIDAVAMKLENREDGTPNYLQAIQRCVNGENLVFVAKPEATPAPETAPVAPATEAPAAPVAETTPALVAA